MSDLGQVIVNADGALGLPQREGILLVGVFRLPHGIVPSTSVNDARKHTS